MKIFSTYFIGLSLCAMCNTYAYAEDILILLSLKTTGSQEVIESAISTFEGVNSKVVNLAETTGINLPQVVRAARSKVVLAIGDKAYNLANSTLYRTPVIGAMTSSQKANTVSYLAPAEKYLSTMRKMSRKTVAVVYSDQTSSYIRRASEIAKSYGITLVRREASSPSEAIAQFNSIKSQVDSLWLLPDTKILTAGSAEVLLRTAQDINIPVFAFSKNYLKNGAAVVIEPDRDQVGKIVGESVFSIVNTGSVGLTQREAYREIYNDTVINRLRLPKANNFN